MEAANEFPLHVFETIWIDAVFPHATQRIDGTLLGALVMAPVLRLWRRTT